MTNTVGQHFEYWKWIQCFCLWSFQSGCESKRSNKKNNHICIPHLSIHTSHYNFNSLYITSTLTYIHEYNIYKCTGWHLHQFHYRLVSWLLSKWASACCWWSPSPCRLPHCHLPWSLPCLWLVRTCRGESVVLQRGRRLCCECSQESNKTRTCKITTFAKCLFLSFLFVDLTNDNSLPNSKSPNKQNQYCDLL
jgi:hypothetical protein